MNRIRTTRARTAASWVLFAVACVLGGRALVDVLWAIGGDLPTADLMRSVAIGLVGLALYFVSDILMPDEDEAAAEVAS
jgi:di/tricarboxylate transporter